MNYGSELHFRFILDWPFQFAKEHEISMTLSVLGDTQRV